MKIYANIYFFKMHYNLRPRKRAFDEEISYPRKKPRSETNLFNPNTFNIDLKEEDLEEEDLEDLLKEEDLEEDLKELVDESEEKIEEVSDEYSGEYFDIDTRPLINKISKMIMLKYPDMSFDDLKDTIQSAIDDYSSVEEYLDPIPKDISWKKDLPDKDVAELDIKLKNLRNDIKENTPTMIKILKSGLCNDKLQEAIQLYDIYKNTDSYTEEQLGLQKHIMNMIKTAGKTTDPLLDNKILSLKRKMYDDFPTIENIVNANLTEKDKIRLLELYESLNQCEFGSDDWYDRNKLIKSVLSTQMDSPEEVVRIEQEEQEIRKYKHNFLSNLKLQILRLDANIKVKAKIFGMYEEMISHETSSNTYNEYKEKIMWSIKLPHNKIIDYPLVDKSAQSLNKFFYDVYRILDENIYGMKNVKEKILQYINDKINGGNKQNIMSLKGNPGVGKTKLVKAISKAVNLPYGKIPLGGTIDSTIFKGSDKVWTGASPSLILQILCDIQCANGIILLDEIDKISKCEKGSGVQHSLLHILDPVQNVKHQDTCICEYDHDLSKVWFITTLNDDTNLDPTLKDRLEIIEIPPYSTEDIINIIKFHTFPETLLDKGFNKNDVIITDDAIKLLINKTKTETGLRQIETAINDIISKLNLLKNCITSVHLTFKLKDFNGLPYTITKETINILVPDSPNKEFMQLYT
jgi:ATP-dependent Lon protease